jgi:hypothetical protein
MDIGIISSAFSGIMKGLDGLFTSDEERLQAKGMIMSVQNQVMTSVLAYEKEMIVQQASIINAEAKGESWIQRSWRPIVMLTFTGLVVAKWLGFTATVDAEVEVQLMHLIQIGLGGYVVGRSGEKIVKSLDLGRKVTAKD